MSRRSRLRAFSAIVALAIVPSMVPDAFAVACPHHISHGSPEAPAPDGVDHGKTGHHEASETPTQDGVDHGKTGHGERGAPCTCLGRCPVSQAPSSPSPPPATTAPDREATVEASLLREVVEPLVGTPAYLHPPANGPPVT